MLAAVSVNVDLGTVIAGVGTLLFGLTGFLAYRRSKRAEEKADAALAASPAAVYEGLKSEVQSVIDTHQEAVEHWAIERHGMEEVLVRERARADAAGATVFRLRGELALVRIDMAAARTEVADLRTRFDSAISNVKGTS